MSRFVDWLDARTGYRGLLARAFDEPVPGGARLWYAFGPALALLLGLQALTGVLLSSYYAPSTATAWASVAFIQDSLTFGWFVRGLHAAGASALIVVAGLHFGQVLVYGAYKAPRELNWILGLLLCGVLLATALTGNPLRWDQKGYWGAQIEIGIVGTLPALGSMAQTLIQGGTAFGNYTLTHLYALHAWLLPALLLALVAAHAALGRRHGRTPGWRLSDAEMARRSVPAWPQQRLVDVATVAAVVAVMAAKTIATHGAPLGAPADPGSAYLARPEWYFLPLFALRHLFDGPLEFVATMVIPGLATAALIALPFIDRAPARAPRRRLLFIVPPLAGVAALGALAWTSTLADERDAAFVKQRAGDQSSADRARTLARLGVPPEGGTAVFRNDPSWRARQIWDERCGKCHGLDGGGGASAPDLKGYGSRAWIRGFLENPDAPLYMGRAKLVKGMKPVKATPGELDALVELVYAQAEPPDADPSLVAQGNSLFAAKGCDDCHEIDGKTSGGAPNLAGRGTLAYVRRILEDAGDPLLFGERNKMPPLRGKLTPEEIDAVARYVLAPPGAARAVAAPAGPAGLRAAPHGPPSP